MKIKKKLNYLLLGVFILVIMFTFSFHFIDSLHAYSWRTCHGNLIWNNGWTNMYISTTSFPPGSAWDIRLQNAMWHWNNIKRCRFNFYVGRDTDGTHRLGNGRNEVYLDSSLSGSTLAVCRTRYHCYWLFGWKRGIDETDIGFNSNRSWSLSSLNYNSLGSPYSFEGVALHELGHALGLLHEDRWMATMNSYYPNSGPFGHYKEWDPLPDDREGARYLYPDSTSATDLAGSVFKRTGSGSSGLVSSPTSATRGSWITIQFTFANLGTTTRDFKIGFYLSTNSIISTADRLLGANNAWATAGFIGTYSRSLFIPSTVAPGTYYLGFIVDYDGTVAEADESNNSPELPRRIVIH